MQKIMFNERYGLEQAVLKGRKTMTRRLVGNRMTEYDIDAYMRGYHDVAYEHAPFKIGEEVAIAQSYHDIGMPPTICVDGLFRLWCDEPGWNNKMFVKAELMPRRIKITDIKVEQLQDIGDEDCLKEGIAMYKNINDDYVFGFKGGSAFTDAKLAFATLIDKVSGKGTWERNPWVFAYSFELVK